LLKLRYPDLACGDAYKALQLVAFSRAGNVKLTHCVRLDVATELVTKESNSGILATEFVASSNGSNQISARIDELEHNAVVVLAEGLLMSNSFSECLDVIRQNSNKFPESPRMFALHKTAKLALAHETSAQKAAGSSQQDIHEYIASGSVNVAAYPWMNTEASTRSDIIHNINDNLKRASREQCYVKRSNIRDDVPLHDPEEVEEAAEILGVFAKTNIARGRRVLKDYTCLCAVDDTTRRCSACGDVLPSDPVEQFCCKLKYCSEVCRGRANTFYHAAVCGKDLIQYNDARQSLSAKKVAVTESRLMLRALAFAVNFSNLHPLLVPVISRLTSPRGGARSEQRFAFSLCKHIIEPIDILTRLGIDVYANQNFDTWVILTIEARLRVNSRDNIDEISSNPYYIAINPLYTFFNHSCCPNVTYEESKKGPSSTLRMKMVKRVQAGEELFISYLSEEDLQLDVSERQEKLRPWFGHDCQCTRCAKEIKEQDDGFSEYED
jgi:hypothetical protein